MSTNDVSTISGPLPEVLPLDEHNRRLLDNVRPANWQNPQAGGTYNLVVIGAGAAGLVSAAAAAGLGARVALIERHLLGGDCLNVGCVPSKAILRVARAVSEIRQAQHLGIQCAGEMHVDFARVMERMRRLRASISPIDSAARYRSLGVDVYFGEATFTSERTIQVADQQLTFRRAIIATGGRAAAPAVPGLAEAGYLTNENVFTLTQLPPRLAVIGAGPIGCELAQAFARFGSRVSLIEADHGLLPNEDRDAAELVWKSLQADGIQLLCCGKQLQVARSASGKRLTVDSHDHRYELEVDEILVAAGRAANIEGLGLEAAQVEFDRKGVKVNDQLRTSNRNIFAAGDICSRFQFTHAADAMARIAVQNALFFGRARASLLTIPWCTYTDPEVAHVGLYEKQAQEAGIATRTFEQSLHDVDRAVLDGADGFLRVLVKKGTDRILGATLVAEHAGDIISEITLAMTGKLGLKAIAKTIHPYPTQAEAIKKIADAYNRTRLKPAWIGLLKRWFHWQR